MDEIVKIPHPNKELGSCPNCGKTIWTSYLFAYNVMSLKPIFKCIECGTAVTKEKIIPF